MSTCEEITKNICEIVPLNLIPFINLTAVEDMICNGKYILIDLPFTVLFSFELKVYSHGHDISHNSKMIQKYGFFVENPGKYHIYEGLSSLTNISRYDLPDPDTYRWVKGLLLVNVHIYTRILASR